MKKVFSIVLMLMLSASAFAGFDLKGKSGADIVAVLPVIGANGQPTGETVEIRAYFFDDPNHYVWEHCFGPNWSTFSPAVKAALMQDVLDNPGLACADCAGTPIPLDGGLSFLGLAGLGYVVRKRFFFKRTA